MLNDNLVEFELDCLSLNHFLLDRVLADEPVYIDVLLLTDTVSTVHSLQINLRIEIAVIKDHMICRGQVDA